MIEVIYKYTCNKCGKVIEQPMRYGNIMFPPPITCLPHGWNRFNEDFICEEHIVGIMDKTNTKER